MDAPFPQAAMSKILDPIYLLYYYVYRLQITFINNKNKNKNLYTILPFAAECSNKELKYIIVVGLVVFAKMISK